MKVVDVTLGELMSSSVRMVAPDLELGAAAQLMSDIPVSCLVVHSRGALLGIVTERDMVTMLHQRADPGIPVSKAMTSPVITARASESFRDGLLLMRQYALHHLVVTDDAGEVAGVVSESDMRCHLGVGIVGRMQNLLSAMDRQSSRFPPETPVADALQRMIFERWDYVVVVQDEMPLGILTERDVPRLLHDRADVAALTLQQVMSAPLVTIGVDAGLFEAVRRMTELHLRHLVVTDSQGRFLGVVSQHGLLERIGLELIGESLNELEVLRSGRRFAEQELREREEIYRTLVNQAADAIVLIDGETLRFAEFNAVAHEGLGYTREEFAALSLPDLQVGRTAEDVRQHVSRDLQRGGNNRLEIPHRRKDGSVRLTQVSSRSVDIRGRHYLLAIWSDITERKRAENALRSSEQKLRGLYELSPLGIASTDMQGHYLDFNKSFERICGYPGDELRQLDYWALTPERYAALETKQLEQLASTGYYGPYEKEYRRKDGRLIPIRLNGMLVKGEDGQQTIWSLVEDISERVQTEERLKLAASVFRDASEGILITDAGGVVIDVNRAFSEITGLQREEIVGQTPRVLKSGRHEQEFYVKLWQQLLQDDHWHGEVWNRRKNGEEYAEQLSISAVKDATGKTTHYVGIFTDITEHKRQQEQIERLAYYDALTRLPNRVLLADRMQQALARADRSSRIVAVCYLDLDGFKPINDRYGHKAGDLVLTEIAQRLQEFVRAEDTVARLGGDEFVLLLTDLTSEKDSEPVLARALELVTQPCQLQNGDVVSVSASVGVTFYPIDHSDTDVLLRHADQAMYQAKQLGRNRMHYFDPEYDQQTRQLRELKDKVGAGLARSEFVLYWQPKVELVHGHVVGAEALLRWKLADGTIQMPGTFLPQLENDDLIVGIGDYVIREGVATLLRWRERGLELAASINVAARQMLAPDFMHKLRATLDGRPDIAARLELEILESAALEDLEKVKRLVNECRALGVSMALDDFGTGYSSMTYFRRLPVDTVKIDQSFVRDMLDNTDDLAIVQGILGLTKAFGKTSVAEGVELVEHLAVLQGMGCHLAQGYAIGHPMPEQEFLHWLENYKPSRIGAPGR